MPDGHPDPGYREGGIRAWQVAIFEIADKYPCYEDPRNQRYLVADEFLQYRVPPPETLLGLIFNQRDFFPLGYAFMQG